MIIHLKQTFWRQFAASIDMFKNAITLWPEEKWHTDKRFFYMAYHTLVFLDYYLTIPPKDFSSSLPYTLTQPENIPEEAIDDVVPDRIYNKQELLTYLQESREKCRNVIRGLSADTLTKPWIDDSENLDLTLAGQDSLNYSVLEILFYNMKHVQHHVAQLNFILRKEINNAPDFVSHALDDL